MLLAYPGGTGDGQQGKLAAVPSVKPFVYLVRDEAYVFRRLVNRALFRRRLHGDVVERFTEVYYEGALFGETRADTRWLGVRTDKCPLDLWIYQELLHELRPDLIVETGTAFGGSALYFASLLDLLGTRPGAHDRPAAAGGPARASADRVLQRLVRGARDARARPHGGRGSRNGARRARLGPPQGARARGAAPLRAARDARQLPRRRGHDPQRPPRQPRLRAGPDGGGGGVSPRQPRLHLRPPRARSSTSPSIRRATSAARADGRQSGCSASTTAVDPRPNASPIVRRSGSRIAKRQTSAP